MTTQRWILIAAGVAALMSGCSQTARYVTTKTWYGKDDLFVATSEVTGGFFGQSWQAKVISCKQQDDHALQCVSQDELNRYLNEGNTEK